MAKPHLTQPRARAKDIPKSSEQSDRWERKDDGWKKDEKYWGGNDEKSEDKKDDKWESKDDGWKQDEKNGEERMKTNASGKMIVPKSWDYLKQPCKTGTFCHHPGSRIRISRAQHTIPAQSLEQPWSCLISPAGAMVRFHEVCRRFLGEIALYVGSFAIFRGKLNIRRLKASSGLWKALYGV